MASFNYEVKELVGVLSTKGINSLELRLVSWDGKEPQYDLRMWYKVGGEEKCYKGVGFTKETLRELRDIVNSINLSATGKQIFGVINPNDKLSTRVQLTTWGGAEKYDIRVFNGNFAIKGVMLSKEELIKLREILDGVFANEPEKEQATEPAKEPEPEPVGEPEQPVQEMSEDERIIHSLTSIPINDSNYPIRRATVDQLRKAIAQMEASPDGNRTRIARCKSKLRQLENTDGKEPESKVETPIKVAKMMKTKAETEKTAQPEKLTKPEKKASIVMFHKRDETPITKLPLADTHHTYEEVKEKLEKERRIFQGDRDSEYVIDGVLEACLVDQELLDNVMRPEKSYVGAFQYFAMKAKQDYFARAGYVDGIGVMDADTALKYALDYFNSAEKSNAKLITKNERGGTNDKEEERGTDGEVHEECAGTD